MADKGEVKGKNFYFAVDYIDPAATAVHGITVEKLSALSGGHTFSEYQDEIYDDFFSADVIAGHNVKFDIGFMIAEFKYLDRIFRYNESFDSMRFFTPIMKLTRPNSAAYKYPKLAELMQFAEVYPYDVSRAVREIFGSSSLDFHDATFDTAALYLSVEALKNETPQLMAFVEKFG